MTGLVAKRPLKRDDSYEVRQSGGHHHWIHTTKPVLVTIPEQAALPVPLLKSILRQAELSNEEFIRLVHYDEEIDEYAVLVPGLPGCTSQGKTREDALANVQEAIRRHIETLRQLRRDIPVENRVEVAV